MACVEGTDDPKPAIGDGILLKLDIKISLLSNSMLLSGGLSYLFAF